jgi:DNA adenine methylase
MSLTAPFPYFGGKSKVAPLIWDKVGQVESYVEPFGGSMSLYLNASNPPGRVILNDLDGLLMNFWRSVKYAPEELADIAKAPVSSLELQARHNYVTREAPSLVEKVGGDPTFYDVEIAAHWLYSRCAMIGGRHIFEAPIGPRIPSLIGSGIFASKREDLGSVLKDLSDHIQRATLTCSSWESVLNKTSLYYRTPTLVFLDPPYAPGECDGGVYRLSEDEVWANVIEWCHAHQDDPRLRIVLCGYEGTAGLDDWECVAWRTQGGYASAYDSEAGKSNASRERIWFSPQCSHHARPLWERFTKENDHE